MSIDPSLKLKGGMAGHRNVLTRTERIAKLTEQGKFDAASSAAIGLPKVGNRKVSSGGKVKKEPEA